LYGYKITKKINYVKDYLPTPMIRRAYKTLRHMTELLIEAIQQLHLTNSPPGDCTVMKNHTSRRRAG
jgi:hypothetical protein